MAKVIFPKGLALGSKTLLSSKLATTTTTIWRHGQLTRALPRAERPGHSTDGPPRRPPRAGAALAALLPLPAGLAALPPPGLAALPPAVLAARCEKLTEADALWQALGSGLGLELGLGLGSGLGVGVGVGLG